MSHRVRSLIIHLNYGDLIKQQLLPKQKLFTNKTVPSLGGKTICPTLSKKLGPSDYGLMMEEVIECIISHISLDTVKHTLPEDLQKHFKVESFKDLNDLITTTFIDHNIVLQPQVEIKYKNIEGHPDLMTVDTIYDIKTTGQFGRMRTETILQLLSYYCLAKLNHMDIRYVGLVLPLQLQIVKVDLQHWQWQGFYQALVNSITNKLDQKSLWQLTLSQRVAFDILFKQYVGFHIKKDSLLNHIQHYPAVQFFLNGNQTSSINYTKSFLNDLKKAISSCKTPTFIHAPYALNLCQPGKKKEEREEDAKIEQSLMTYDHEWGGWTFYCLKNLLLFGQKVGVKGVVIHCGKTCKRDYKESLTTMRDAVIACSLYATPECPILIETCAGQTGEVLADPEELCVFYNSLPGFVRDVVKICLDSAHTHSAGYHPMLFINTLIDNNVPIALIHYNDCKFDIGCKKDRHAFIGNGKIGYEQLNAVLLFAIKNQIPMVVE
ncbi:MAG TPA: TIM barrel protein [Candidatus Saccharimonadales bacterium]|nr:TIM barrel protein [Candidatus Saccharimonadales bacterium]